MIYSKTLQASTYPEIDEPVRHMHETMTALGGTQYRFDHLHRAWEYGLVLSALIATGARTVLDVGGGGSVFAPTVAMRGIEITQVDPKGRQQHWAAKQAEKLGVLLPYIRQDFYDYTTDERFDAVVSLSVIEHVSSDVVFWKKMLNLVKPGGLVAITTDFHPAQIEWCYNKEDLLLFYMMGKHRGFDWLGDGYDYTYTGEFVSDYTFASLVLRRADGD